MTTTKLLLIAGHQRSGTTMLTKLCNTHPKIALTSELRQFTGLGRIYPRHLRRLRTPLRHPYVFPNAPDKPGWRWRLYNLSYTLRYALGVFHKPRSKVWAHNILRSMSKMYPHADYVGDKYPDYIYQMWKYKDIPDMVRLVIYRDPRDVTASTLERVSSSWQGQKWTRILDTPAKVAERWLTAMQITEDFAETLYVIRYEDLVTNPKAEMVRLGEYLQVDPELFDTSLVFDTSVGSFKRRLTAEQITEVEEIAGPYLARYGYV